MDKKQIVINTLFGGILLAGLYLASLYSYLLFHTVAELIGIAIGFSVFILVWNSRRFIENSYLLLLGIALLFVTGIDVIHTMAFKGMAIFPGYNANLPTQLWIISRYLQSITLLIAVFLNKKKINMPLTLSLYSATTIALAASCFLSVFPACYAELTGLTSFKIISEYIIIAVLSIASVGLWRIRKQFDSSLILLLLSANLLSIGAEFSFTKYFNVYGVSNLVGHLLKTTASILWYFAIVKAGVARPADILYHRLSNSEEKYKSLFTSIDQGFALHEIITDSSGNPVDYVFLDINNSYTKIFGVTKEIAIGRRIREIMPDVEQYWIDTFGKVALTGVSGSYDNYLKSTGKYYSTHSYSPRKNQFAVLVTDITDRRESEERIKSLLAEKELILKEVHHRIKNNMNTIISLLSLQALTLSDASAKTALEDAGNRIRSMSLLYDKLYRSSDFSEVSAEDYIPSLVNEVIRNFPNCKIITIETQVDDFRLDVHRLQVLGIIINELLTNIMKYAFIARSEGRITVSATKSGGKVVVTISDNGSGIPETVSFENSTGFGLQLIQALTAQLDGTIRIERGGGTKLVLEFEN